MLLDVKELRVHYDQVEALRGVSLEIEEGKFVTIVGSNGAGKSTLLKAISGLKKVTEGTITFQGQRIDGLPPYGIAKLGIIQVPEGRRLFPYMTVLDNLLIGAFLNNNRKEIQRSLDKIFSEFPILKKKGKQHAESLSGGQQQMLAIARGLMANPKILLMDEPSLGLAPVIIEELRSVMQVLNRNGMTIILAEQNISLVFALGQKGYFLQLGKVAGAGDIQTLTQQDVLKDVYF